VTVRRLVIATTLLICLMLAPHAGAATPRAFYGLIPADDPSSSEIARMGAGKVGTMRVNFVWGAVQPTAGAPLDFSHYDAIIGEAAKQGIRVLPTVYSSPAWAAKKTNYPPTQSHTGEWRTFLQASAARYGANGTFWSQNPSIPKLPVINWQFWNEANSPSFWFGKPNPRQYVNYLRVFSGGIKAGDPSAKVVLAGLFRTPRIRHGIPLDRFLPAIYKRKGAKGLFDAVAMHPYATTPRDALTAVQDTRKIMSRFKDKRTPLWITEVGWATGGSPPTALTVTPRRQASYLRQTFNLLAANRKRFKVAGVIWYSWRDTGGGIWFQHTGLFTAAFDPKPAWSAFTGLTGGTP
jgi:polysaccharide biosynthesis protein PslG